MGSVMHLNIINDTPVLTVMDEGKPLSATMGDFVGSIIDRALESEIFHGKRWPVDAEFATVTRYHTWPMGWDKNNTIRFYASDKELQEALNNLQDWAMCEDNQAQVEIWHWDFAPTQLDTKHFG